jgi:hypothetical protein
MTRAACTVFAAFAATFLLASHPGWSQASTCATSVDDGSFEDGFPVPFGFRNATMVQRLVPPFYPALLTRVCVCWSVGGSGGGHLPFNLVVYADGTIPGASLGSVAADSGTVLAGPVGGPGTFANISCSQVNAVIPSGGVYVGANWDESDNDNFFVCGDTSSGTPVATMYSSTNSGNSWHLTNSDWPQAHALGIRAQFAQASGCIADSTTLCIDQNPGDRRFQVQAHYQTSQNGGLSGSGNAIPLSSLGVTEGGLFWFFGATNPEMLIKIIDGCSLGGHFWVFFAATTNVGFTVTVTDTSTGHQAVYHNKDLTAALPVQDTAALSCP